MNTQYLVFHRKYSRSQRTIGTIMRYLRGWRASSTMGTMLGRFLAMFTKSRPDRTENSTAYTTPSCNQHF